MEKLQLYLILRERERERKGESTPKYGINFTVTFLFGPYLLSGISSKFI